MLGKNGTLSNISKHYKAISQSKAPKSFFYSYASINFPEVYFDRGLHSAISPGTRHSCSASEPGTGYTTFSFFPAFHPFSLKVHMHTGKIPRAVYSKQVFKIFHFL